MQLAEIAALAAGDDPGAVDRLIELLSSATGSVARAAAAALAARHPEAADRVIAACLADGARLQEAAADFLARLGDKGEARLLALLGATEDDEPEHAERMRELAGWALRSRGAASDRFLAELADLGASTPSADVRGSAVDALACCGPAGWLAIERMLAASPADTRCDILGRMSIRSDGDLEVACRLAAAVVGSDPDPAARSTALSVLLDLRSSLRAADPSARTIDDLFIAQASAEDSDLGVGWRVDLARSTAPGTPGRREFLEAALAGLEGADRANAITALAAEPGSDDAWFGEMLRRELSDPKTRGFATSVPDVQTPRSATARPAILEAIGSVTGEARANLLRSLAHPPRGADSLSVLIAALRDPDATVVIAACGTLAAWGTQATGAYDALLDVAEGGEVHVAASALRAAARTGRIDDRMTDLLARIGSRRMNAGSAEARYLAEAWVLAALAHEPTRRALVSTPRERLGAWGVEVGRAFDTVPATPVAVDLALDLWRAGMGDGPVPRALLSDASSRARIVERLRSGDAQLRVAVIRDLGRASSADPDLLGLVAEHASDPDPKVRLEVFHVFQSAYRTPDEVAVAALRDLDAADLALRLRAAGALLWNSRILPRAKPAMRDWLGHASPSIDDLAVGALHLLRDPLVTPTRAPLAVKRSSCHFAGLWGAPAAQLLLDAIPDMLGPDREDHVDAWFHGWWLRTRRDHAREVLSDAPPRDTVIALLAAARRDGGAGLSASAIVRDALTAGGDGLRAGAAIAAALDPSLLTREEMLIHLPHAWDGKAVGLILALRRGGTLSAAEAETIAARAAKAGPIVREAAAAALAR